MASYVWDIFDIKKFGVCVNAKYIWIRSMICVSASIAASTLLLAGFPSSATADNYDLSQDSYLNIPIQETGIVDVVLDGDTF